jgi:HK97 family phage prohead protease
MEELLAALQSLIDGAAADGRDLTEDEAERAEDLSAKIERAKATRGVLTRSQSGVERRMRAQFRAEVESAGKLLRGHAAVFDQVAELWPGYGEELASTAFDEVLKRDDLDTRALFNHDPSLLLGRSTAGTLRLGVDSTGLEFEVDLPNTTYANDLRELISRGDVTGASFGFMPGVTVLTRAEDGSELTTHTSIADLLDVSPVAFPAYSGTDVALRSKNPGAAPAKRPVRLARARARLLLIGATQ